MKYNLLLALSFLALGASAQALDPVQLNQNFARPKYLVPIAPYGREYEESISQLLNGRVGNGTMIYYESPHTGADFVVSVWGKDYPNGDYRHARHNFITLIEVSPGDKHKSAVAKKQLEVPIDDEFAVVVQRAWATMLLKTRYPTHRYLTLNGWQAEFYVEVQSAGGVYGQLNSPVKGLPKELMDLGFALADYCRRPESDRREKRDKLVRRLKDFEDKVGRD